MTSILDTAFDTHCSAGFSVIYPNNAHTVLINRLIEFNKSKKSRRVYRKCNKYLKDWTISTHIDLE